MSNPFEGNLSPNRDALERQAAAQKQLEDEQRRRQYQSNSELEYQRYDALVTETLEQLRDAVYPTYTVIRHGTNLSRIKHDRHSFQEWQIGVWKEESTPYGGGTGSYRTEYFETVVSVDLDLAGSGRAQAFIGRYSGHMRGHMYQHQRPYRQLISSIDREALSQMLIELHQPTERVTSVLAHSTQIRKVLARFLEYPTFQSLYADRKPRILVGHHPWLANIHWDPLLDDSTLAPSPISQSEIGPWLLQYVDTDPDYGSDVHLEKWVGVYLLVNENAASTHYKCTFRDMEDCMLVSPEEQELYDALRQMISRYIKQKQPRKWGIFGR